jgi:uncharacterized protein with beta-barrel porin domain
VLTENQQAVYDAFVAPGAFTTDLAQVRASVDQIDPARAADALDSFSGEIYADTPAVAAQAGSAFARLVDNRMAGARMGISTAQTQTENGHGVVFWLQGIANFGSAGSRRGAHAYGFDIGGAAAGLDASLGEGIRGGIAAGYSHTSLDVHGLASHAKTDSYHLGGYVTANFARGFLDAQASYGHHAIHARRRIITGNSTTRQANGSTDANEFRASLKAGADVGTAAISVRPVASLSYDHVGQGGFVEKGAGDAGLAVHGNRFEALTAGGGVELSGRGALVPFADLSVTQDLIQHGWASTAQMIGGGSTFRVGGSRAGRTAGVAKLGIAGAIAPGATFRLSYGLEARKDLTVHSVSGGLSFRW